MHDLHPPSIRPLEAQLPSPPSGREEQKGSESKDDVIWTRAASSRPQMTLQGTKSDHEAIKSRQVFIKGADGEGGSALAGGGRPH